MRGVKRSLCEKWCATLEGQFRSDTSLARVLPKLGPQQMIHELLDRSCWTRCGVVPAARLDEMRIVERHDIRPRPYALWGQCPVTDMAFSNFSDGNDCLYVTYAGHVLTYDAKTYAARDSPLGFHITTDEAEVLHRDNLLNCGCTVSGICQARALALDRNGNDVWIATTGCAVRRHRLTDGHLMAAFATVDQIDYSYGTWDSGLVGIATDSNSNVFVWDDDCPVVRMFDANGRPLRDIGAYKRPEEGNPTGGVVVEFNDDMDSIELNYLFPTYIATNSDDQLLVVASTASVGSTARVVVHTNTGTLVRSLDDLCPGSCTIQKVMVDADDNIIAIDDHRRVFAYRADGTPLGPPLHMGAESGVDDRPIAIDRLGRLVTLSGDYNQFEVWGLPQSA